MPYWVSCPPSLSLIVTLTKLNVTGDVTVNSSYVSALGLGLGRINGLFSLVKGTTIIGGQILTQNTTFVVLIGGGTGTPIFSIDAADGSTATLILTNAIPINTTAANGSTIAGSIDFYNSTGTGQATVNYAYAGTGIQSVYTTTGISNLDVTPALYQNLVFTGTGNKRPNVPNTPNGLLTVAGNIDNSAGSPIDFVTNTNTVRLTGTTQTIAGGSYINTFLPASPVGTVFYNLTSSAATTTLSGNNNIAAKGVLAFLKTGTTAMTINANATNSLTLLSNSTGDASLAALDKDASNNAITASITGAVNVQRYANGGTGRRNYRLLSSPVNQSTITTGVPSYGFTDLQATTMISGYGAVGTYNGSLIPTPNSFDLTPLGNPSVMFYYEPDKDSNDQQISKSSYKGLKTINEQFPIGNGFLFFFRGDRSINGLNGQPKTSSTSTPQNTTMNFSGTPNQGNVIVNIPANPISTVNGNIVYSTPAAVSPTFSFTPHTPGNNDGTHLVGNPYACAIDLDKITLTNSSLNIYMLNNSGTIGVYQKGSKNPLNNGVGQFVLSGQGFFIQATSSAASLTFTEACKTTAVPSASIPTTFAVAKPRLFAVSNKQSNAAQSPNAVQSSDVTESTPHIMDIILALDSVNNNEAAIQFGEKTARNSFDPQEDAYYVSGPAQTTFLASYTKDNQPCLINHMGSLDSIKTIPLYAEGQIDGIYTLKFKGASAIDQRYKFYLVDNFKNDSLDLSVNDTYTFNIQRANKLTFGDKRFALVRHDSGLHYNLLAFNGTKQNNSVALNWKTEYEGDYTSFVLQRSTDEGKNYTNIDSLQATGSGIYTYIDTKPIVGTNQYRLIQKAGADPGKFSNIVAIDFLLPGLNKFKIYPNPTASIIKIDIGAPNDNTTLLNVKIYNINGLIVSNIETTANQILSQDVSQLARGSYILRVTDRNNKIYGTKTFIKL
jgi:hypothetical protein